MLRLYPTFRDLVFSFEYDQLIFGILTYFKLSYLVWLYLDPGLLLLFYGMSQIRNKGGYLLAIGYIVYQCYFGVYWVGLILVIIITLIRLWLGFRWIRAIREYEHNYVSNSVFETFIKRMYILIRMIGLKPLSDSFKEGMINVYMAFDQDGSNPFDQGQLIRFRKFFQELESSKFLLGNGSLTIFFPTFILRLNSLGVQLTDQDQIKLIQSKDECPICRDQISEFGIQLKCNHTYCHECIFEWLNLNYTCPLCRAQVE